MVGNYPIGNKKEESLITNKSQSNLTNKFSFLA